MTTERIDRDRTMAAMAIPYSAQTRGYFDKIAAGALDADTSRTYDCPANRDTATRLNLLAMQHGVNPTQAMLGFFSSAPFPAVPIVVWWTAEQVTTSFSGADLQFDADEIAPLPSDIGLGPVRLSGNGAQMNRGPL